LLTAKPEAPPSFRLRTNTIFFPLRSALLSRPTFEFTGRRRRSGGMMGWASAHD